MSQGLVRFTVLALAFACVSVTPGAVADEREVRVPPVPDADAEGAVAGALALAQSAPVPAAPAPRDPPAPAPDVQWDAVEDALTSLLASVDRVHATVDAVDETAPDLRPVDDARDALLETRDAWLELREYVFTVVLA